MLTIKAFWWAELCMKLEILFCSSIERLPAALSVLWITAKKIPLFVFFSNTDLLNPRYCQL